MNTRQQGNREQAHQRRLQDAQIQQQMQMQAHQQQRAQQLQLLQLQIGATLAAPLMAIEYQLGYEKTKAENGGKEPETWNFNDQRATATGMNVAAGMMLRAGLIRPEEVAQQGPPPAQDPNSPAPPPDQADSAKSDESNCNATPSPSGLILSLD